MLLWLSVPSCLDYPAFALGNGWRFGLVIVVVEVESLGGGARP